MRTNMLYTVNQTRLANAAQITLQEPLGFNPMNDSINYDFDLDELLAKRFIKSASMFEFFNIDDRPLILKDRFSIIKLYIPAKTFIRTTWLGGTHLNIFGNGTYGGQLNFIVLDADLPPHSYTIA